MSLRQGFNVTRAAMHTAIAAGGLALAASALAQDPTEDKLARVAQLEERLASLEQEVERLEDTKAIKRLQRAYGYYLDKGLADEMAKLFADDPATSVEYGNGGIYIGKERIGEYLNRLLGTGLEPGRLNNHLILQGVVNVAPDGMAANGRWRALIQTGEHGETAIWSEGPYENEYVKEDGVWKFKKIHWYTTFTAPYDPGWHQAPQPMSGIMENFPPDEPPSVEYEAYPGAYLPPYHYANPVSGRCEEDSCDADQ